MFHWSLSPLCEVGTLIAEDSTECRGCSDPPKLGGPGRSGVELWAQDCPAPKARLPRAAGCRGGVLPWPREGVRPSQDPREGRREWGSSGGLQRCTGSC